MEKKSIIKELTLLERIMIVEILPTEGSWQEMKIVRDLGEMLYPTKEEEEKYEIKTTRIGNKIVTVWNDEAKAARFNIEFREVENDIIAKAIRDRERDKRITMELISVYDKFGV